MNLDDFIRVASFGVETAMMVSAPVLVFGLLAGVGISILQAATQINDAALAFIPKILAAVLSLIVFGPWMIGQMVSFATFSLNQIPFVTN